jgi:hypothetical protein
MLLLGGNSLGRCTFFFFLCFGTGGAVTGSLDFFALLDSLDLPMPIPATPNPPQSLAITSNSGFDPRLNRTGNLQVQN